MPDDFIAGFVQGIVKVQDPAGGGRVKALLPGLKDPYTEYWIKPACWPGAGGLAQGSQYPAPPLESQIYVMFEYGLWMGPKSSAVYLTGYYGFDSNGSSAGPAVVGEASSAVRANKRTVVWEDETKRVYIVDEKADDEGGTLADSRIVLETRAVNPETGIEVIGCKVELNAADGTEEKAHVLYLEARSGVSIYSQGVVDIQSDTQVKIQGRVVGSLSDRNI